MNRKGEMLKMRLDGHTYRQIADKMGISPQRVQKILSPPTSIRLLVIKRTQGLCEDCGILLGWHGAVHHEPANGEEDYNDLDNLHLLCASCHRKRHWL